MKLTKAQLAEYELRATMAERERCAKIADQRAALWRQSMDAGIHGDCAMSLLEECEDIATAIRAESKPTGALLDTERDIKRRKG